MEAVAAVKRHIETELGMPVDALELIGVTAYNDHYRLVSAGTVRHIVVYNLPDSLPLAGVRFEHSIIRHLLDAGFDSAPSLIVHEGESLFRADRVIYALTEWIEGCHDEPDRAITADQLRASGHTLAAFHRATQGFTERLAYFPEHIFVYTTPHFLDAHEELLAKLEQRVADDTEGRFNDAARAALGPFVARARQFFGGFDRALYDRVRAADDTGIVHGDYRRLNLVFSPDGVAKVLDYNCCFNDIRLWDVAYSALSFGGHETVGPVSDPDGASAFIAAYHEAAPLTADEWQLLPDYLSFVLAKLMTASIESWWMTDRADSLVRLLDGQGAAIVAAAQNMETRA